MHGNFIHLTPENLDREHLCCIIRTKKCHPGIEAKRQWLAERLKEGHVFRKLDVKGCVFIELASAPGGADKNEAEKYGCKYVCASGLPAFEMR